KRNYVPNTQEGTIIDQRALKRNYVPNTQEGTITFVFYQNICSKPSISVQKPGFLLRVHQLYLLLKPNRH
ncbi:MAG: hypothetical protein EAZ19_09580, partial [Oscillatoriales cyanobacterium]|uniref:hypothetical protein n=1 Tax=Microcoleus sp. PH2017_38_RDM_U_B TaxID=2798848 RepID=UPI0025E2DFFD